MAGKFEASTKRLAISKANAQVVGVVAVACFVTIFCLFAAKAVWSQNSYRSKVISAKEKANNQLQANITAFNSLSTSYKAFDNAATNVIGGISSGTGDDDGSNSKIILDALPTTYDFPALTSSIEKILDARSFNVTEVTGTDDQVNQQTNLTSTNPQPVEMPFSFTVQNANYNAVKDLIAALGKSIRPIAVDSIDISGGSDDMTVTVNAHTYYQPAKSLTIEKKTIK
jgi:hypothetical protein